MNPQPLSDLRQRFSADSRLGMTESFHHDHLSVLVVGALDCVFQCVSVVNREVFVDVTVHDEKWRM